MSTITQFTSGNTQYRIEFDYLARTFVVVTLVNSSNPTLNRVLEVGRDYRFLNPTMIEILVDQTGFDIVRIHRQTGTDLVVDFRNGSVLTASDLTNAELQSIHIAEEGRDQTVDLAKEYADAAGSSAGNAKDSEDEARRIAESIRIAGLIGYITRRSFEKGFNVTTWSEVLLWEADGNYYRWDGALPKNVPAGSTPDSTGGVKLGAWVNVGDAALRSQISNPDGATLYPELQRARWRDVGDVRGWNLRGDGSDEAVLLQQVINTGNVFIPKGMIISHSTVTIPKGTQIKLADGAALRSLVKDALSFEKDEMFTLASAAASGTTTLTLASAPAAANFDKVMITRSEDTSDSWYIANAQNPDQLGYQGEVFRVLSIDGATITLASPLPWELTVANAEVRIIKGPTTKITGGNLINGATGSNYMYQSKGASLIKFEGTSFDYNGNGGSRHDTSYGIKYSGTRHKNRVGNGNVFLGYGSVECTIEGTEQNGGAGGDAQIIVYAGCRNIVSKSNKCFPVASEAGVYIGAKCIGGASVSDHIKGGKYGFISAFGAQKFSVDKPVLLDQLNAAIFAEQCQNFEIESPVIRFIKTGQQTVAAILLKDSDSYVIDCNIPIDTGDDGYIVSSYSSPAYNTVERKGISLRASGKGSINLSSAMVNFSLVGCDVTGDITLYNGNIGSSDGFISNNRCRYMVLHSLKKSEITDTTITGNQNGYGIRLSGNSRWNNIRRSKISDVTTAFFVNPAPANIYTNAFHEDNMIDYSTVTTFVSSPTGTTTPATGVLNPAPVRNFFLPSTGWQDAPTTKRTISGWRHKGTNTGVATDWFTIAINEA